MPKGRPWTARQTKILKKEYPLCQDPKALAKKLRKTYKALTSRAKMLGVKRKLYAGGPWTPVTDRKLIKWYPKKTCLEIGRELGLSESQVSSRAFKLRLSKDPAWKYAKAMKTAFKKGNVPANKGRKQKDYMTATQIRKTVATRFKKGQLPKNTLKDGTITIRFGNSKRKNRRPQKYIRLGLAKWQELQRYNWEKKYGPIPKGMCLWCRSGDTMNCRPSNWELITRRQNVLRNSGSMNLADGWVAFTIVGKNRMDMFQDVLKNKELIELKRQDLLLKRAIKKHEPDTTSGRRSPRPHKRAQGRNVRSDKPVKRSKDRPG